MNSDVVATISLPSCCERIFMQNQPLAQNMRARAAIKSIANLFLGSALFFAALLPSIAQAPSDVRIALVIGNAAYPGAAALTNPGNERDAAWPWFHRG
jgi:hypothetical protein